MFSHKLALLLSNSASGEMEDDQNERRPEWKTTKMENDQNGRQPKWNTTKMEEDQMEYDPN